MRVDSSLEALYAFSQGMTAVSNNIANINTDEFKSAQVRYETGPEGQGVGIAGVFEDQSPGALVQRNMPVENAATGMIESEMVLTEMSNTDLAREMVGMINLQRGYEANIAVIRTWDQMIGTLVDELV